MNRRTLMKMTEVNEKRQDIQCSMNVKTVGDRMNDVHSSQAIIKRVAWSGMAFIVMLSGLKLAVGLFSGSQALIADAVHSLSDWFSDLVLIVGIRFWTAPADDCHPHGHGRIETMISLGIGTLLLIVGGGLTYRACMSLQKAATTAPGWTVFTVAVISMVIKEILYHWTIRAGKRVKSSALIANAWHHRSDALSSLPVAMAAIGQRIWPEFRFFDPLAAIVVAVFILQAARKIIMPAWRELIDAGVSADKRREITEKTLACDGVVSLHQLRTRWVGSGVHVDLHIQVDPELTVREGHAITPQIKKRLRDDDVIDVLVHVEPVAPPEVGPTCTKRDSAP